MELSAAKKHLVSLQSNDYFKNSLGAGSFSAEQLHLEPNKLYVGATASGTGMTDMGIDDGDFVIIEISDTIESGEVGMFVYGEAKNVVCRLYKKYDDGSEWLIANKDRKPIPVSDDTNFTVAGKIVTVCKSIAGKKF